MLVVAFTRLSTFTPLPVRKHLFTRQNLQSIGQSQTTRAAGLTASHGSGSTSDDCEVGATPSGTRFFFFLTPFPLLSSYFLPYYLHEGLSCQSCPVRPVNFNQLLSRCACLVGRQVGW